MSTQVRSPLLTVGGKSASAQCEIEYARKRGKRIRWLLPVEGTSHD